MNVFTDDDYVAVDPFAGDESDVRCRSVRIRRARARHTCYGLAGDMDHTIEPGQRYRHERALVDGTWGEFRMCFPCLDAFLEGDF